MKNALRNLAACVLAAAVLLTPSCNAGSGPPRLINPPAVGSQVGFKVIIYNFTQWELNLGYATSVATGQTGQLIVPSGDHVVFDIGFLPASVSVTAVTTALPSYTYPTQTQTLGVDYNAYATEIGFVFQ